MDENDSTTLQTLTEIKQLMERSSRFISLSGMSGVFAGIYALTGALAAYLFLDMQGIGYYAGIKIRQASESEDGVMTFLVIDATIVLILAIGTGILLTTRKARKDGNSILDNAAKKLIFNLSIPLIAGGLFCLGLMYHGELIYVAPATLVFYGLALIHASAYTRDHIRNLGYAEILLGLISLFVIGYGFIFWVMGFGILHIFYGTYMYYKYEV